MLGAIARVDRRMFIRSSIALFVVLAGLLLAGDSVRANQVYYPDLVADWGEYDNDPIGTNRVARVSQPEEIYLNGGSRLIVRFDGYVSNIGDGPIRIQGNPQTDSVYQWLLTDTGFVRGRKVTLVFENDDGHNHWHLENAMTYSLWDSIRRRQVTPGAKVGFCLYDINRIGQQGPTNAVYTGSVVNWCDSGQPGSNDVEMGTSAGWSDIYGLHLSYQWVDISEVTPGTYYLAADADTSDQIEESDETNNGVGFHPDPVIVPGYVPLGGGDITIDGTGPATTELVYDTYGEPGPAQFDILEPPEHGTVSIDSASGILTYTPFDDRFIGTDRFTYTVYDSTSRYPLEKPVADVSVELSPPQEGPVMEPIGDQELTLGEPFELQIVASDPNGDTLIYGEIDLPEGLHLDPESGLVSGTPTRVGIFYGFLSVDDPADGVLELVKFTVNGPPGRLLNGSFETPETTETWTRIGFQGVPHWSGEFAGADTFDIWRNGWTGPASDGDQFAELNVRRPSWIHQDFSTVPGDTLYWSFDHRGRVDDDTVRVFLGDTDADIRDTAELALQGEFTTPAGAWVTYTGSYTVPAGQTMTRIRLNALDQGSEGNFVDNVVISDTPPPPPPPVGEFTNGSFETPVTATVWERLTAAEVDGWSTLSGGFDMWSTGWNGPASDGDQFTELNTNQTDGIYQDFATTPGQTLHWSFDHRGRLDDDTVQLHLGAPGALTLQTEHTTPTGTWTTYTGSYTVPAGQTITRIQLQATDPGSAGNFVDNVVISDTPPPPPPPVGEFTNGSFETPVTATVWERLTAAQVDGWSTLSGGFDMWSTGWNGPASDGDQFTELNTNQTDGIYQDFATTPGQTLHWSFDHRGRLDDDTVQLHLGAPGALTLQTEHTTPTGTWTTYTGSYTVPAGQTITRIQLQATDPGSAGNFIDNITITTN